MSAKSDLSILVLSCDKYKDLWVPLFYCFDTYWHDCPYPILLGSNTVKLKNEKVVTLLSGPDKDWSSSLRAILKQIHTPYIFLWLDDIFPTEAVYSDLFSETLEFMKNQKAKHIHIEPSPKPDKIIVGGKYGLFEKGAPYRSITFGFWDVSYLSNLLIDGENPWNFEIMGSYRTAYTDGFYCSMKNIIPRIHVVEKGRIFQEARDYCLDHNIPLDTSKRSVLASGFHIKSEMQKVYFNMVIKMPWKMRLAAMNMLRKLLISY